MYLITVCFIFILSQTLNSLPINNVFLDVPDYDPMLSNDLFEGDILNIKPTDIFGRNAHITPQRKWSDGKVPYSISTDFSEADLVVIKDAMEQFHKLTCIKFVEKQKETDYLLIQPGSGGCSSSVGRQTGKQELNLGKGCIFIGIIQHELMHTLGFWHEQSRPDRDKFIEIHWDNIEEEKKKNFKKYSSEEVDTLNLDYDITSLLHYGPFSFAINFKKPTITAKDDNKLMGQRSGFSQLDVTKINKYYKCSL